MKSKNLEIVGKGGDFRVLAVPRGVVAMADRTPAAPKRKMPVLQEFCDNMAP
jgi:hypothetical protein